MSTATRKKTTATPSKSPGRKARSEDKAGIIQKVLEAALKLNCVRGHLRWKMTELSRLSGIRRGRIYYYFGKSRDAIMQSAMQTIVQDIFGLSETREKFWADGRPGASTVQTRNLLRENPWFLVFYLTQRRSGSPLHEQFRDIEKRYMARLSRYHPDADPDVIRAVYCMIFGLTAVSDHSDEDVEKWISRVLKLLKEPKAQS